MSLCRGTSETHKCTFDQQERRTTDISGASCTGNSALLTANEITSITLLHGSFTPKGLSYCSICRNKWDMQKQMQVDIILLLLCPNIFFLSFMSHCLLPYLPNRGETVHSRNLETLHFDNQYFLFVGEDKRKGSITMIHDSHENDTQFLLKCELFIW